MAMKRAQTVIAYGWLPWEESYENYRSALPWPALDLNVEKTQSLCSRENPR